MCPAHAASSAQCTACPPRAACLLLCRSSVAREAMLPSPEGSVPTARTRHVRHCQDLCRTGRRGREPMIGPHAQSPQAPTLWNERPRLKGLQTAKQERAQCEEGPVVGAGDAAPAAHGHALLPALEAAGAREGAGRGRMREGSCQGERAPTLAVWDTACFPMYSRLPVQLPRLPAHPLPA